MALWKLDFNSELVYVGDAGATEPNRPSTRRGVEWNNRWVPMPWLLVDVFNLFDRKVNDIEYFYESQLKTEAAPVADCHVHPAEPRTVRVTLKIGF